MPKQPQPSHPRIQQTGPVPLALLPIHYKQRPNIPGLMIDAAKPLHPIRILGNQ